MGLRVLVLLVLLLAALTRAGMAQAQEALGAADRAMVVFDGEALFEVRGVSALPAAERGRLIHGRLMAAAADPGFDPAAIAVTAVEDGLEIGAPGRPLVVVYPADARLEEVQPHVLATAIQSRLARAIADYRAARTPEGLRRAVWHAVLWTVAYAVAIAALVMAWRAARAVTDRHVAARIAVWEERARNVVRLTALWDTVRAALRSASSRSACSRPTSGSMPCSWRCPGRARRGARRWRWCPVRYCASPAAWSRRSRS